MGLGTVSGTSEHPSTLLPSAHVSRACSARPALPPQTHSQTGSAAFPQLFSILLFDLSETQGHKIQFPIQDTFTCSHASCRDCEPSAGLTNLLSRCRPEQLLCSAGERSVKDTRTLGSDLTWRLQCNPAPAPGSSGWDRFVPSHRCTRMTWPSNWRASDEIRAHLSRVGQLILSVGRKWLSSPNEPGSPWGPKQEQRLPSEETSTAPSEKGQ